MVWTRPQCWGILCLRAYVLRRFGEPAPLLNVHAVGSTDPKRDRKRGACSGRRVRPRPIFGADHRRLLWLAVDVVATNPQVLAGPWRTGWALDLHTASSQFLGNDLNGRPQFDTVRTEVGELMYQLKYNGRAAAAQELAAVAVAFLATSGLVIDVVVAVPPSKPRAHQPVVALAQAIAGLLNKPVDQALVKAKETAELKSVTDFAARQALLANAFTVPAGRYAGASVLLLDDLFRSGATAAAITGVLYGPGQAKDVHVMTMTKTRSNR